MNSYVQDATVDWLVKSILVDVRLFYLPEGWELIAQFEQFVKTKRGQVSPVFRTSNFFSQRYRGLVLKQGLVHHRRIDPAAIGFFILS